METEKIEYIRKNGRRKGRKKGVLWCGIDPDDDKTVILGFTLCHAVDRFDYPGGNREEGFGKDLANIRAEKYRFHTDYFVQKTFTEGEIVDSVVQADAEKIWQYVNPQPKQIVEIPPSVMVRLKTFIERCKTYYKDKEFPVWVEKIANDHPYPYDQLEKKLI